MKNKITTLLLALLVTFKTNAQAPAFQWAKSFEGASNNDIGYAVTTDASGNVYTTGYFQGTTDFDPGVGIYTLTANGGYEIFVSKLNSSGNLVWAIAIGSGTDDQGNAIKVDASGNVYFAGYFTGTADFDPGVGVNNLISAGQKDIFICKLNPTGGFVWARSMGGALNDVAQGLSLDGAGNLYSAGSFYSTVDFDPSPGVLNITSAGGADAYINMFDLAGNMIWTRAISGTNDEIAYALIGDGANITTAISFGGTVDFDPGPAVANFTSAGGQDIGISRLNVSGNYVWARQMGSTGQDEPTSIDIDPLGNIYTAGSFQFTCDFDPGPGSSTLTSAGSADAFISKLNSFGNIGYAKKLGGSGVDVAYSIKTNGNGDVFTTGYFMGTSDFDPGAGVVNLTSSFFDVFISKLNSTGNFSWVQQIGGSGVDASFGLDYDNQGNIYTTGYFQNTADFDPGVPTYTLTSAGAYDAFVNKLSTVACVAPPAPSNTTNISNQIICNGNTTTLNASSNGIINWYATPTSTTSLGTGTNFITSTLSAGTYTYYAEASTCTISVLRTPITVTVNPSPTITVNSGSICSGQSFTMVPNGANTYTFTGGNAVVSPTISTSYTVTGTSAGCVSASVAISNITVVICTELNSASIEKTIGIKLYPNPNNGIFYLQIESESDSSTELLIYNSIGELVYSQFMSQGKNNISPNKLNPGLYFYSIINKNQNIKTGKIIIE